MIADAPGTTEVRRLLTLAIVEKDPRAGIVSDDNEPAPDWLSVWQTSWVPATSGPLTHHATPPFSKGGSSVSDGQAIERTKEPEVTCAWTPRRHCFGSSRHGFLLLVC